MTASGTLSRQPYLRLVPVRLGVWLLPPQQRDRYREEWTADVNAVAQDGTSPLAALLWACGILVAAVRRSHAPHRAVLWTLEHRTSDGFLGTTTGLAFGMAFGLAFWLNEGLLIGLGVGLIVALIVGLSAGLHARIIDGLNVGLIIGVSVGLSAELIVGLTVGLVVGLIVGLGTLMFSRLNPEPKRPF